MQRAHGLDDPETDGVSDAVAGESNAVADAGEGPAPENGRRGKLLWRFAWVTLAMAVFTLLWFMGALFVLVNWELEFPVGIEMAILCGWVLFTLPVSVMVMRPVRLWRRLALAVIQAVLAGMLAAFFFSAFGEVLWILLPWA